MSPVGGKEKEKKEKMADTQQRIAAVTNYVIALYSIANGIDAMYPAERARVGAWETEARAKGVFEGNIIAVLGPFNVWEEIVTTLSGGTIPREIMRVQQGGAVPHEAEWASGNTAGPTTQGDLAPYRPPPRISLPSIDTILASQGGALAGASQYSGNTSVTVPRQDVAVPASVATSPNVVQTIAAQYPAPPPQTMTPPDGDTQALPYPTSGISGALPTAPSSKTGGGPSTISPNVGGNPDGSMVDYRTTSGAAGVTGEPDVGLLAIPAWVWGLGLLALAFVLVKKGR